jgi:hypothetical protein
MEVDMRRLEGESFEAYKVRRTKENKRVKQYLKGRLVWIGRCLNGGMIIHPPDFMGTYRRPVKAV